MLWQQCLNKLETELSDQEINTWLRTLHGTQHDKILVLLAPNTFVYQHVNDHHLDLIKSKLKSISGSEDVQVILQIGAGSVNGGLPFTESVKVLILYLKAQQLLLMVVDHLLMFLHLFKQLLLQQLLKSHFQIT